MSSNNNIQLQIEEKETYLATDEISYFQYTVNKTLNNLNLKLLVG